MNNRNKSILLAAILIAVAIAIFTLWSYLYKGAKPAFVENPQTQPIIDDLEKELDQPDFSTKIPDEPQQFGPFLVHQDFKLDIFSRDTVNPRVLIFDNDGNILVSEPSQSRVSLFDSKGNRSALISNLSRPHGLAIKDDKLYVAETGQVVQYDYSNGVAENPKVILDLPAGGRHWTRTLGVGPEDGHLYISIGSSCNICIEEDWRRDKILQYNFETQELKVYASGLRNAVFFEWNDDGQMWATEMGRDWLGDDLPPDEILLINEGKDYGFPFCYGNNIVDPEYADEPNCDDKEPSFYDLIAHEAPLGIDFLDSEPIIALHGSWNRSEPVGYEVIRLLKNDYQSRETLISGWLLEDDSSIGRPAGVLVDDETGQVYISDDKGDVIYKLVPR